MTTPRSTPAFLRPVIFITGASRSGTTLLSFILRNHPDICGLRELHYFGEACDPRTPGAEPVGDKRGTKALAHLYARQEYGVCALRRPSRRHHDRARALLRELSPRERTPTGVFAAAIHQLSAEQGRKIPCEQTPRNIFYARALLDAFPAARVVHMVRDPRAVMASQKRRWRRRALSADPASHHPYHALREWINYHPYTMAALWNRATLAARALSPHPRFHLLRFEDLLARPEAMVKNLCEEIELPFHPGMLDVPQVNSSHQSSRGGARRGIRRDAIDGWQSRLDAQEIRIAERMCGELMRSHGYEATAAGYGPGAAELRYLLSYCAHLAGAAAINPRRAWIQLRAALPGAVATVTK
jgi:hypothetical protein